MVDLVGAEEEGGGESVLEGGGGGEVGMVDWVGGENVRVDLEANFEGDC